MRSLAAVCACSLALVAASVVDAGPTTRPRCFGAASRDPLHPCQNPRLRRRVTPRPSAAILQPDPTCHPPPSDAPPPLCTFGAPAAGAASTMALYGDSHAAHWRPALAAVATGNRWHAIALTRPSCPFSAATPDLPQPKRRQCIAFNRELVRFAGDHPEIATVVVSESRNHILARPGSSERAQEIAGYIAAWRKLPASVRHVVVIRDPPYDRLSTADCVERALRRRRDAGRACALPRASSLKPDPAVIAAHREERRPGSRVRAVDLSAFFCGRRLCFPVVGGVLVHKDDAHLTLLYSRTLGPYLLRAIDRAIGQASASGCACSTSSPDSPVRTR